MKNYLITVCLTALAATLNAAPLDKPVAVAAKELTESDPRIHQLWEHVALADMKVREARTVRERAIKQADAKIGDFLRTEVDAVLQGIRREVSGNAAQTKKAKADLELRFRELRKTLVHAAEVEADTRYAFLTGGISQSDLNTRLQAAAEASQQARTLLLDQAKVLADLQAQAGELQAAIAAQDARIAQARKEALPDLASLDASVVAAESQKTEALGHYKTAVAETLTNAHPESRDAIVEFFQ